VRAPTIESDMHLLLPGEFHADTTKLVQLLRKDHHGVRLDAEAWDRLITWIDLNTPAHGTWSDILGEDYVADQRQRRRTLLRRYAGRDEDPEAVVTTPAVKCEPVLPPSPLRAPALKATCPDWPFDATEAVRRQDAHGASRRTIDLGQGIALELVWIPPGRFLMGDPAGHPDEQPAVPVLIEQGFWMGRCEITNEQYRLFDPVHDSGREEGDFLQFSEEERGYPVNRPRQPVVRVSWQRALEFCAWLSRKTAEEFSLPTESQWEYACRAGTDTSLTYGRAREDFAPWANLADASLRKVDLFSWGLPVGAIPPWRPAEVHRTDGARVSAAVGSYRPNAWGLHDMHGNVAEWTRSRDTAYPYRDADGRNDPAASGRRVVRGGSWDDRPGRARSAFRLSYWPYQRVYDVGFRVVSERPFTARSRNR
ncbi:MAG: formylglycine-generating enzyme family protein, partial [Gemmataceae bacterium]|nr:formylglycine-generating enzyme family protein [Gemmataceae bacterium]